MNYSRAGILLAGSALFIAGVAMGQQAGTDKFNKYLQPARMNGMGLMLLYANLDAVRTNVASDPPIPIIRFDEETRKFVISRLTRAINMTPSELGASARTDFDLFIKPNFPEAVEGDVMWEFFETNLGRKSVADYKNGILVFR
jgi:hypothetical protein